MSVDSPPSNDDYHGLDVVSLIATFDRHVSHLSFGEMAKGALAFMAEHLNVERGSVALLRAEGDGFRIFDSTVEVRGVESGRIVPHGSASLSETVEQRQTIYRPDIRNWPNPNLVDMAFLAHGFLCTVSVPLLTGERCVGTMNAASGRVDGIAPATRTVIELLAPRLAYALEMGIALDALAESESRFRIIFDTVGDGIVVADTTSRQLLMVNAAFAALLGRRPEDVVGLKIDQIHPTDQLDAVVRIFASMGRGETSQALEIPVLQLDGKVIPIDVTARATTMFGRPCIVGVFRDARLRRQRETEQLQVQKLESIRTLAAGIAHDFNNLLTGLVGNVSLAQLALDESSEPWEMLGDALGAADRATELTRQLLTFAKGGAPVRNPTDVGAVLRDAASSVTLGTNVQISLSQSSEPCIFMGDEGQLEQVFQNLLRNAVDAMPEGGVVALRVGREKDVDNEAVFVEVSDQGLGIPPDQLDKIFLPFFTTKHGGRGLGLAVAYSIVQNHGGRIGVDSTVGVGTKVRVSLPAPRTMAPPTVSLTQPAVSTRRLLVMDDEPMVLEVARRVLMRAGYMPEIVTNGSAAIEAYRDALAKQERFDGVILDLTVPGGMGGREAAVGILALDPSARLMVSSGYSDDALMAEYRSHGFHAVLPKPYGAQQLRLAVTELLA
jgi:PAS domain S-box-containing protein